MNIAIALTLGNLMGGILAIILSILYPDHTAQRSLLLIVSLLCDVADGRAARKLGQTSLLGSYLDSLSDVVSFGVAPALLVIIMLIEHHPTHEILVTTIISACILVCCGAWRLARFHTIIQENPTAKVPYYLGMPITINGIIFPLRLTISTLNGEYFSFDCFSWYSLVILLLSSYLMISTHKFPKW